MTAFAFASPLLGYILAWGIALTKDRARRRRAQRMTAVLATRTADDVFERPPWCGTCDEWTRKIEVEIDGRDAMQNCTRCHPLAVAS